MVAVLDAAPDAGAVPNHDGQGVEQRQANSTVFAHIAEGWNDERSAVERAPMDGQGLSPETLSGGIDRDAKVPTVVFSIDLCNLADRPRQHGDIGNGQAVNEGPIGSRSWRPIGSPPGA